MTQCHIVTIVAALNVEWATDGNRSLTPPIVKTRRNGYKIVGTAESMHITFFLVAELNGFDVDYHQPLGTSMLRKEVSLLLPLGY